MPNTYNTIHIFGFGVVQVIGDGFNHQVDASLVQLELAPCVANVYDNKPIGNNTTNTYHAINVFNNMFADWLPREKDEDGFRVPFSSLDPTLFEALALAVIGFHPTQPIIIAP